MKNIIAQEETLLEIEELFFEILGKAKLNPKQKEIYEKILIEKMPVTLCVTCLQEFKPKTRLEYKTQCCSYACAKARWE